MFGYDTLNSTNSEYVELCLIPFFYINYIISFDRKFLIEQFITAERNPTVLNFKSKMSKPTDG